MPNQTTEKLLPELRKALEKISDFCPRDTTVDMLDESPEMRARLHSAEIGDTARAGLQMLDELEAAVANTQQARRAVGTLHIDTLEHHTSNRMTVDFSPSRDLDLGDGDYPLYLRPAVQGAPTKPDNVLQAFWDRQMQGYRFVMANGFATSSPASSEGGGESLPVAKGLPIAAWGYDINAVKLRLEKLTVISNATRGAYLRVSTENDNLKADHAQATAELTALREEVARLNKWADSFTDAHLKERQTGDALVKEVRELNARQAQRIADLEAQLAAAQEGAK